jgi:PAS domain S-box-containing protein
VSFVHQLAVCLAFACCCFFLFFALYLRKVRALDRREVHQNDDLVGGRQAVERKTAFLEALLDASSDGVIVLDGQGNRIFQNRRNIEIMKIPPGIINEGKKAMRMHVASVVKNYDAFRERVEYLMAHPEVSGKDQFELTDGTIIDRYSAPVLGEGGEYYGRIWASHDITEWKRAEEALQESENKFRNLAEKSVVGIYVVQDGVFKYVNARFAEIHGYTPEEMIGLKGMADVVLEEDRLELDMRERRRMSAEKDFLRDEFRVRTKRGEIRSVELYGANTVYEGEPAMIGTVLDVTERRHSEEMLQDLLSELEAKNKELEEAYTELRESQKKAIQQEKMASIGQLAAGVAHEINNPMGFIMSNLGSLRKSMTRIPEFVKVQSQAIETLAEEAGPSRDAVLSTVSERRRSLKIDYLIEDSRNIIEESLEGAERVKRIVQDLKSFSRVDDRDHAPADLNNILDSTLNIVWNEVKHKAAVKKNYGDIPQVPCNAGQLGQVFMNIFVNAAQAIPDFGEISIKTWELAGYVYAAISDTGNGIPESQLNRIFEPFYTTKEIGKGTGLGLSIAYDIVKKHKGDIEAISEPGKGTVFVVAVPVNAS